ncbi:hypothetical protein [Enhygromyxa salina]|uniref:Uncharacterized protein n=1 Tax=Enhygromyxa salina TaxID=215803 RepID=A0A2S9YJ94_9BACT|nr:hypothetical protein [Enhygromyxa salina]PRQ05169.1 hypothetical protein ENSA7_47980 [Enhygromyxa salina]
MREARLALGLFALMLLGCPSPPTPEPVPAPARVEPPAPPPVAPPAVNSTDAAEDPGPPPPTQREVIRRRCKRGFSTCHGGRECCNDLLEVCGRDNRCHPLE